MKRVTFIFALLLATATMMAEEFTIGKLKFQTLSDTEVELEGADKGITNIYLNSPITYQGKSYSLTSIRAWAFQGCTALTSVTIGNSVKSIGEYAFYECTGLTSVTIGNSVTSIGGAAFEGTAFYNNQSNWDNGALYLGDCLIRLADGYVGDYNFKANTRLIADAAFFGCTSLTSVTIPNSVKSIGDYVFSRCSSLTSISIPNSVTSIGNTAFSGCSGLTSITIPNSVTSIGHGAFYGCTSLTSVTIPNSVTSIGGGAFYGTAFYNNPSNWDNGALYIDNWLIAVDANIAGNHKIKENTRLIANEAFSGCESLTSVTIPNSVTSIGNSAFDFCISLTSITIPNSVTTIGDYVFSDCESLTSITIPNSVTSIGEAVFSGCYSLTSVVVEQGNIKYDSRDNCNAIIETASNTLISGCQNTIIPNSVTSIRDWAFAYCESLTSITIPNSVKSIGYQAFGNCTGLTSITIPNSVTSIGDAAFYNCSGLTSIIIPNSVTSIGGGAFAYCETLTEVVVPSHTTIGEYAFPEHTQIIRK